MIKDFSVNDRITDFFLLKRIEVRAHGGGSRLVMVLGDRTGDIDAVIWDNAEKVADSLQGAEVVKVAGTVGSYRNKAQLTVEKIRRADAGEYDPGNLRRASQKSIEELGRDFIELAESIENEHLKTLLLNLSEKDSVFQKWLTWPAGKKWHHDYFSGLADHSLSLARLAVSVSDQYPFLDRDLLIAGALLHDLGKVVEFEGEMVYDYSTPGRLVGHIVMGDQMVTEMIRQIEDFPKDIEMKLRHLILSHHGELDKGAVVKPKMREAYVLHLLDEIDSKLDAINKIAEKADDIWSEYIRPLEDYLYFG